MKPTIYALSSGSLPSGVLVARVSGPACSDILTKMTSLGESPPPRHARLSDILDSAGGEIIDRGLVLYFPSPNSFTGEDVIEFHCHGGVATLSALLDSLSRFDNTRLAEPGEFSRRAFENGKFDLTELEGLADIITAQTEQQRRQAMTQAGGALRSLYDSWRDDLLRARALLESNLDFSDEDDVDAPIQQIDEIVSTLLTSIRSHLDSSRSGEIIRDGFRVVLLGLPNSGKSSLLNCLVERDVAIVTPEAGTTRDIIEVNLDIDGHLVIVSDTAGIRDTDDVAEREGVRRALAASDRADLRLWLHALDNPDAPDAPADATLVYTKRDLVTDPPDSSNNNNILAVSTKDSDGTLPLTDFLRTHLASHISLPDSPVLTRRRHRDALGEAATFLESYSTLDELEFRSEQLRLCSDCLGRLTGRIDVEDLLDVIFSNFCIGK